MHLVEPKVFIIQRPAIDWRGVQDYLQAVKGLAWYEKQINAPLANHASAEKLVEFAGRLCYRSWEPGLNPNVTKVREDAADYLTNILKSGHGSVLEHASWTFVLHNVSRVFTHELVRHRVGVAISQESLRYVRLTDIPFWLPQWAQNDKELLAYVTKTLTYLENIQQALAYHFGLDNPDVPFHKKKEYTSFMRRLAPMGLATGLMWTANARTLRHVIERRTDFGAEEEIRLVFDQIAQLMLKEAPLLFGDYHGDGGKWETPYPKV